jgi:hypothetical protein
MAPLQVWAPSLPPSPTEPEDIEKDTSSPLKMRENSETTQKYQRHKDTTAAKMGNTQLHKYPSGRLKMQTEKIPWAEKVHKCI